MYIFSISITGFNYDIRNHCKDKNKLKELYVKYFDENKFYYCEFISYLDYLSLDLSKFNSTYQDYIIDKMCHSDEDGWIDENLSFTVYLHGQLIHSETQTKQEVYWKDVHPCTKEIVIRNYIADVNQLDCKLSYDKIVTSECLDRFERYVDQAYDFYELFQKEGTFIRDGKTYIIDKLNETVNGIYIPEETGSGYSFIYDKKNDKIYNGYGNRISLSEDAWFETESMQDLSDEIIDKINDKIESLIKNEPVSQPSEEDRDEAKRSYILDSNDFRYYKKITMFRFKKPKYYDVYIDYLDCPDVVDDIAVKALAEDYDTLKDARDKKVNIKNLYLDFQKKKPVDLVKMNFIYHKLNDKNTYRVEFECIEKGQKKIVKVTADAKKLKASILYGWFDNKGNKEEPRNFIKNKKEAADFSLAFKNGTGFNSIKTITYRNKPIYDRSISCKDLV